MFNKTTTENYRVDAQSGGYDAYASLPPNSIRTRRSASLPWTAWKPSLPKIWERFVPSKPKDGRAGARPSQCELRKATSGNFGFTLIELLVVISIIGIIFYLSLPAIRNITKSDAMGIANRQIMDDVARAKRLAINHRTTVYMVFIPPNITQIGGANLTPEQIDMFERLAMRGYGFFARRSSGDQPGRETPRYFGEWRALPEGIFIAPWKFTPGTNWNQFSYQLFPFPTATNTNALVSLPCVAFNYLGQLVHFQGQNQPVLSEYDEIIPLTRGSLLISTNTSGIRNVDFQEIPPGNSTNNFNYIRIDWLTGRCKVERPEIL